MHLLAEFDNGTAIFLVGLLMVVGVLLMRASRQLRKAGGSTGQGLNLPSLVPGQSTLPADAPKQLARWEVALHEVTREHTARLDGKIAALQQLLVAAQQEGARLERLVAEAARTDGLRRTDDPIAGTGGPHLGKQPAAARVPAATTQAASIQGSQDGRYDAIVDLARQGLDRATIARRTGVPIGEVELVLGLRRT